MEIRTNEPLSFKIVSTRLGRSTGQLADAGYRVPSDWIVLIPETSALTDVMSLVTRGGILSVTTLQTTRSVTLLMYLYRKCN